MSITDEINKLINDSVEDIRKEADNALLKATPKLVAKVFNSGEGNNGRNWKPNAPSTIKRKKHRAPNIETGDLMLALMEEGFILDDNYMDDLPIPPRTGDPNGYEYANEQRSFDNIGRTAEDEKFLEHEIEQALIDKYK